MIARGEFLEHAQVFDNCYGTGLRAVEEALARGEQLLLSRSTGRARARCAHACRTARSIFILPPSRAALEAAASGRAAPTPMR